MSANTLARRVAPKRPAIPGVSEAGETALTLYAQNLRDHEDLAIATVRNYLGDLRQFVAWCETYWSEGRQTAQPFDPASVATPTITAYRSYLQDVRGLRPTTVNRALVSIKRYCSWASDAGIVVRDPSRVVRLVNQEDVPPRQLSDREENALVAAVSAGGNLRDITLIVLTLHTGLRAAEACSLTPGQIHLGRRSGVVEIRGKGNKYREVPLNATARAALGEYLPTLPIGTQHLFPSRRTGRGLSERAFGHLLKRYAVRARLVDVSPHDLRHRFGYRMAESVPLHRLAQIMGHYVGDLVKRCSVGASWAGPMGFPDVYAHGPCTEGLWHHPLSVDLKGAA
jgi:integrase/recombinase XerD